MHYRTLGRTGLRVSDVGFGAMTIGGEIFGATDDQESLRALHRALDLGMNFIDTADAYGSGTTDEFIDPIVIGDPAQGRIRAGDSVFYWNFRPDRARQLTHALSDRDFDGFDRGVEPPFPHLATMTRYKAEWKLPAAFEAERGWVALRVAGKVEFSTVGLLAQLTGALAEAGVPLLAISTYETDILLVKATSAGRAVEALRRVADIAAL